MTERILSKNEIEYHKLDVVATILENESKNHAKYIVQDVYLDFGANWMWTTICRKGYLDCQVLSPREWQKIILAESFTELVDIAHEIMNDKYFGDK